jgi:hypothetical protein
LGAVQDLQAPWLRTFRGYLFFGGLVMAKRFTDSEKWKQPFLRGLKAPYKLLWLYILDDCDHAGIWQVDIDVAQIRIGEQVNIQDAIDQFGDKVIVIDNGQKWYIPDFIDFQYGELNPENRVHQSVLKSMQKWKIKPLVSPFKGAKDKDKEKDTDKDKEKRAQDFEIFWEKYGKKVGKQDAWNKWKNIKQADIELILQRVGLYVSATPELKYRKDPERYLSHRVWEDEIYSKPQAPEYPPMKKWQFHDYKDYVRICRERKMDNVMTEQEFNAWEQ